jgi:hypothetical protein
MTEITLVVMAEMNNEKSKLTGTALEEMQPILIRTLYFITNQYRCISLIGPNCELTYISSSSYLGTIVWDENVTLAPYSEGDITIEITGPYAPYTFNYFINETTGYEAGSISDKFRIQFEFLSSLAGYNSGNCCLFYKI